MRTSTTIRSPGAIALGVLFALGTAYVLFADLTSWRQITVDHVMTMLVLIGTIAAGKMFWHQARAWRVGPSIGLAVLFAAGTSYCVTTSAARNAEATVGKLANQALTNDARKDVVAELDKARGIRDQLTRELAGECRTGKGKRCEGVKTALDHADSHVRVLEARLEGMKPPQVEDAGLKHAAKVFAAVPGVTATPDQIYGRLVLFTPFVKALFLEIATIVFLGIGLGERPGETAARVSPAPPVPANDVEPGPRSSSVKPGSKTETSQWVQDFRARNQRNPKIPEFQARFPVPKTTAWRRIKAA